jgi:D-glycero-alpha-D-manno-heptose-7-phosphate kinase
VTAEELADRACTIEIDRCRKPIGKQDQYAAAFGGICDIHFGPGDRVVVDRLELPAGVRRRIQDEFLLFYTGITRSADSILGEQTANIADRLPQLHQLRDLAAEAASGLRHGEVDVLGTALNKGWQAKRALASRVSNAEIDEAVDSVLAAGATGAKVTGAGGGGFLLVVCPLEHQRSVRARLAHLKELPISLDPFGSRVILNVHRDIWG